MPTKRIFRLVLMVGIGGYFAGSLIKMAARRHLAEDDPGSIGAKFGAAVSA